jgi:N utilization substance protein A
MPILKPRTEFAAALNQICAERGIEPEVVLGTIQEAILAAYKRDFGLKEDFEYSAEVDQGTGETHLYCWKTGQKVKTKKEITPPGFGRIAAQVAKQVLLQKVREAEKSAVMEEYSQRLNTLVNGMILRFDGPNIIVDMGKAEGVMPPPEQIPGEKYQLNQRLVFLIKEIQDGVKGKQIIVSRASEGLIEGLFRREVPEVSSGAVQIKVIAREAGGRSKVAVLSTQVGVDPVGSCVGQKGVRVQAVIDELGGEKIDIIQYSEDPVKFITAALSPAEKLELKLAKTKKNAVVYVPEDQLSLAIGKTGQNVRLASKLTGYKIDIKEKKASSKKPSGKKKTQAKKD